MIGKLKPIPLGHYTPQQYPGGKVFSCPLEIGPGVDTYSVNALNINYIFQITPIALVAIANQNARLGAQIIAQTNAKTLNTSIIAFTEEQLTQTGKQGEALSAAYGKAEGFTKEQILSELYDIQVKVRALDISLKQIAQNNETIKREISAIEDQKEELGLRESRELLASFIPLNVTARLVRGVEKEVVWVGTLTPALLPLGNMQTELENVSIEAGKPKAGPIWRVTKYPQAQLVYETHVPLQPFTLEKAEPLELIITIAGPPSWMLNVSGTLGTGLALAPETNGGEIQVTAGPGKVEVLASENSVNYTHDP